MNETTDFSGNLFAHDMFDFCCCGCDICDVKGQNRNRCLISVGSAAGSFQDLLDKCFFEVTGLRGPWLVFLVFALNICSFVVIIFEV